MKCRRAAVALIVLFAGCAPTASREDPAAAQAIVTEQPTADELIRLLPVVTLNNARYSNFHWQADLGSMRHQHLLSLVAFSGSVICGVMNPSIPSYIRDTSLPAGVFTRQSAACQLTFNARESLASSYDRIEPSTTPPPPILSKNAICPEKCEHP